jgi:hypothetical protein
MLSSLNCYSCRVLAVERSWNREFFGDAAQALWGHIKAHCGRTDGKICAHYAAIVQSSGMGKSRTVDEMSKEHFVIPINLLAPFSRHYLKTQLRLREIGLKGKKV